MRGKKINGRILPDWNVKAKKNILPRTSSTVEYYQIGM